MQAFSQKYRLQRYEKLQDSSDAAIESYIRHRRSGKKVRSNRVWTLLFAPIENINSLYK